MAIFDFLGDIFGGGGSSQLQQTIIPTGDLFSQAGAMLPQLAGSEIAYNAALAPGLTDVQLGVERQFDPNIAALREATSRSILDELSLGNTVPMELQDLITTNALQQLGTSGVGTSDAGKIFGARSLLSAGLDLAANRRNEALKAVRTSPLLGQLFQPRQPFGTTPGLTMAEDIRQVQAAQDQFANLQEAQRKSSFTSLLSTGARLLGMAGGAFLGSAGGPIGAIGGAAAGGQLAGSLFGGGGGGGGSILSGLGGLGSLIGGPQFGVGGGQLYGDDEGNVLQSTRAAPIRLAGF